MIHRINEIKKLLRYYDYVPIVKKMGDGVILKFPHAKFYGRSDEYQFEAYAVKRGKGAGLYYNSNTDTNEKFLSIPEYAVRLFVMHDVSARCQQVPISDKLVYYFDEGGGEYETLTKVIDPPSTKEEKVKEGYLNKLYLEALSENFPIQFEQVAKTHGVYDGYRLIKAFFEER